MNGLLNGHYRLWDIFDFIIPPDPAAGAWVLPPIPWRPQEPHLRVAAHEPPGYQRHTDPPADP